MTKRPAPAAQAALALRLLLNDEIPGDALERVDWHDLLQVTTPGALLRTTSRLAALGARLPTSVLAAVERERCRARAGLDLIGHTTRICATHGIACLFPKAYQHYPDMGDDVDVLLLTRSRDADRLILSGLPAVPHRGDLGTRLAGSAAYALGAGVPPLDIQHGRVGTSGEDTSFPALLWAGRQRVTADGVVFDTAAPEHLLVLHGLQRVYGRSGIDLADAAAVIALVRRDSLDWPRVLSLADELGVSPGLSGLLAYVEQIHQEAFARPALPAAARYGLDLDGWGVVRFDGRAYRYPLLAVGLRVYGHKFVRALRAGRWEAAARLCFVPLVGVERTLRRLGRARRGRARVAPPLSPAFLPEGRHS